MYSVLQCKVTAPAPLAAVAATVAAAAATAAKNIN